MYLQFLQRDRQVHKNPMVFTFYAFGTKTSKGGLSKQTWSKCKATVKVEHHRQRSFRCTI